MMIYLFKRMMMEKKKLLVSFSGGETSGFMAQWLWNNAQDEFDMVFVFANTGQENEETLEFVQKCSDEFGFPVVWVEALVQTESGKGTKHKVVQYETANRSGKPFEDVIKKFGIPNQKNPHCTRELKERPITSYVRSLGWEKWFTAIGIRNDEVDRVNSKWKENRYYYPLVSDVPMTKKKINFWWKQQSFRLPLKGYQGNCKTCWKKSDPKLYNLVNENRTQFNFFDEMEVKYAMRIPKGKAEAAAKKGKTLEPPFYFFRSNRSTKQIIEEADDYNGCVKDDSRDYSVQFNLDFDGGSCEVFTKCEI